MEYVEGRPLRDKIGRVLETSEILDIGIQATDAFDEAHSKGVTHRDIKPGNIMITPRGQVKVLDFGLAKVTRPSEPGGDGQTATQLATDPGVVLYEMATGRLPFSGTTPTETLSRILQAQPEPMASSSRAVPAELERIVRKCLEKDRERRYQSARELLVDLRNLKRDSDSGATAAGKAAVLRSDPRYQDLLRRMGLPP